MLGQRLWSLILWNCDLGLHFKDSIDSELTRQLSNNPRSLGNDTPSHEADSRVTIRTT